MGFWAPIRSRRVTLPYRPGFFDSPNGDCQGDEVMFRGTFLRNYKDSELHVYDEADQARQRALFLYVNTNYGKKNFYDPLSAAS